MVYIIRLRRRKVDREVRVRWRRGGERRACNSVFLLLSLLVPVLLVLASFSHHRIDTP